MHRLAVPLVVGLTACSFDSAEPEATTQAKAAQQHAGAPARRIYMDDSHIGRIRPTTPYDRAVLDRLFRWRDVAKAEAPTFEGGDLTLLDDDDALLTVFPDDGGDKVGAVWSTSKRVRGVSGNRVGRRLRELAGWTRMACDVAPAPFEGHVACGRPGGRVWWHLDAEGIDDPTDREALAEHLVVGVRWGG